jgi:hypothetical protein|tara:strand:+ start:212 stop:487 length:276 start_codon:yes stop_codon:yes gene_type:complete
LQARDGVNSSLRLKPVDLIDGCGHQDARGAQEAAKTFATSFLPVDPNYVECLGAWVTPMRDDLLFGHDDALFPPPEKVRGDRAFCRDGTEA